MTLMNINRHFLMAHHLLSQKIKRIGKAPSGKLHKVYRRGKGGSILAALDVLAKAIAEVCTHSAVGGHVEIDANRKVEDLVAVGIGLPLASRAG